MRIRLMVLGLAAGLVAIAVTGGVALAQEGDAGGETGIRSFVSRLAEKLGLEEQQVQDAVDEVQREMHDERVQKWLDRLVEDGVLTQDQADEYLEWYQSRPADLPFIGRFGGGRHHAFHFRHDSGGGTVFMQPGAFSGIDVPFMLHGRGWKAAPEVEDAPSESTTATVQTLLYYSN